MRITQHVLARDRARGILIESMVPAIRFFQPENLNLVVGERLQAFKKPLSQPSPFLWLELKDFDFQVGDGHTHLQRKYSVV